jgi:hypothetical protein
MRTLVDYLKRLGIVIVIFLLSIVGLSGLDQHVPISVDIPYKDLVFVDSITRDNINIEIAKDPDWYISKYAEHLNRNELTIQLIWKYSQKFNEPFNISIAVGIQESDLINYNPKRPVNRNKDGSFDWGIYQLNSKTYPNVINNYGSLEANIKGGVSHLHDEYVKTGVYDISIMTYNCGNISNINKKSIERLKLILGYEKDLDEWLNCIYRDKVGRNFSSGKISK